MRYKGQHHSIKIPVIENRDAARLRSRFDQEYLRRYGHANAGAEVEIVVLHSLATLHMKRPETARLAGAGGRRGVPKTGDAADLLPGGRSVFRRPDP